MKTQTIKSRIVEIVAAMLAVLIISFSPLIQAAQSAAPFDHTKTGFILRDVHLTLKCEQCHVDGIFKNTPKDCAGCHTVGTRVSSKPKPINHVPTTAACDTCHTSAATFLVKSYKHVGITGGCLTCHNGQSLGVLSKPVNHFPTSQPCENCHKNTSTFLSWTMDHTGITTDCATCHTTGRFPGVLGLPPAHIPIPAGVDCVACHATPPPGVLGTFLGALYDHSTAVPPVAGKCISCHTGAYIQYGVKGMSATHFPTAGAECDTCHTVTNTSGYTTFLGATFNHALTTAACSTCHMGQYASVVSFNAATHIPSPAGTTCDTCHTSAITGLPASLTPTFKNVVVHTNALASALPPAKPFSVACSTCHSGSFVGQNATGKGTAHIPTTVDCGTCHTASYQTFAGGTFLHTGLPAATCGTCHMGQYNNVVSINTAIHIPQTSGNACDTCHTNAITGLPGAPSPTFLSVKYHTKNVGLAKCSTCHNGSYLSEGAQAKNIGHVTTTADCVTCHTASNTINYTTFLGATFSHTPGTYAAFPADGATATPKCSSCHNGTTALGKVSTHVPTTGDCNTSSCHSKATTGCPNCLTFYGVKYDHVIAGPFGVSAYTTFPLAGSTPSPTCSSCHNGSTALAKNTGHIPTTADCISCHTPTNTGCGTSGQCTTFLGASYSHVGIAAGSCGTCHQGQYASVVSINTAVHIPQSSGNACDACHTNTITGLPGSATPTFLNVKFHANALGNPPTGTCTSCHSGTYVSQNALAKNTGHITTTSDCVSCHTATNTGGYVNFLGAAFSHSPGTYATFPTGVPATPTCSSCHNGTTAKGKSTGHVATTADCISCHVNTATSCPNCTTFLGAAGAGPHTVAFINGQTCVSCHNGTTATGTAADALHIPIGGIDCGQCHAGYDGVGSINFGTGAVAGAGIVGAPKYGMNHTGVPGTCLSCHGGAYVSQGLFGALPKVTNHIPTTITGALDCTTCHTTFTTPANIKVVAGSADWLAETMNHNNAQGGAPNYCVTCHLSGVTYLGKMQKKSHNGASTSKDCSVSGCHKPLGSKGTSWKNWT